MKARNLVRGLAVAAVGFAYGAVLAFLAGMSTGGGHGNIMLAVFTSPLALFDNRAALCGTPFVWMLIGFLVGTLNSVASRFALILVMAVHYGTIPLLLEMMYESDWKTFTTGLRREPETCAFFLLVYAVGHVAVWWSFVSSLKRRA